MPTNQIPQEDPEMAYDHALGTAITRFHDEGGLWVDTKFKCLDDAYNTVWISPEYEDWYCARRDAFQAADQVRLSKGFKALVATLMNRAIEQIAKEHLASEKRAHAEDAA
jgi:hypothetical protein